MDFCGIIVLQFVSHPPSGYGISFYCDCTPPTVSLWFLLCLWVWGIFFVEFQCLPVDDCSEVVIPVLSQEGVSTRPSTPLLEPISSSWFADGHLLAMSSHGREREEENSLVSLYKDTNSIMEALLS